MYGINFQFFHELVARDAHARTVSSIDQIERLKGTGTCGRPSENRRRFALQIGNRVTFIVILGLKQPCCGFGPT
jgi:hypothetical protein